MSKDTKQTLKDKTAKGLLWGGFNSGAQQLLNLIFGVWLSRILSIEDYGMIGVLTIFTLLATTLQESGFTQALANKQKPNHDDFNAVFWCSSAIGVTIYLFLFYMAPHIESFFAIPKLTILARVLFLGFVLSSFGTAHNAYLFKHMMVKERTIAMLSGLLISGSVGVIMAYNGFAYWGLAIQHLTYILCTNLLFWYFSKWRPTFSVSFKPILEMYQFSSKILITKLCLHLNNQLFNVLLGRLFGKKEVGYFSQANKWNLMGSSIISETIQNVAQPVLRNVVDQKERQSIVFFKLLQFTSFVVFPALFGLAFIAPEFITITLTEKWLPSASLLQILCLGGAFLPINHLFGNLIISKGYSATYMWNTIALCSTQLLLALLSYPLGINYMIWSFVGIQISWMFIWFILSKKIISINLSSFFKAVAPYCIIAIMTISATYYITQSIDNIYFLLICKIFIVTILYLGILYLLKSTILLESIKYLKQICKK